MKIGKTQFMVEQVVRAVIDGQPASLVVAHTQAYAMELRTRVGAALWGVHDRQEPSFDFVVRNNRIMIDNGAQTVDFVCISHMIQSPGHYNAGFFVDHFVYEFERRCASHRDLDNAERQIEKLDAMINRALIVQGQAELA